PSAWRSELSMRLSSTRTRRSGSASSLPASATAVRTSTPLVDARWHQRAAHNFTQPPGRSVTRSCPGSRNRSGRTANTLAAMFKPALAGARGRMRLAAGLALVPAALGSLYIASGSASTHAQRSGSAFLWSPTGIDGLEPRWPGRALIDPPSPTAAATAPKPPPVTGPTVAPPARPKLFTAKPPPPPKPPPDAGVYLPAPLIAQAY